MINMEEYKMANTNAVCTRRSHFAEDGCGTNWLIAVKITLGPKGRNVVLDKQFGSPLITNDGVTIAKEIELEEPFENMGAQLCKEVAEKTHDNAGDGTTTATILAQAIIEEGLKHVTAGVNPIYLKRGLEKATKVVHRSHSRIFKSHQEQRRDRSDRSYQRK